MIKASITLLLFLTTFLSAQEPEIGLIRVYNLLSNGVEIQPLVEQKELSASPIKPGETISGIYYKAGKYEMEMKGENLKFPLVRIVVKKEELLNIIVVNKKDSKETTSSPRMINFRPRLAYGKDYPLNVISYSINDAEVDLKFDSFQVPAGRFNSTKKWDGSPLKVKLNGETMGTFKGEGNVPHTLIIWDKDQTTQAVTLIPHINYTAPKGLRKDLSFGKKREEFQNLKTLKPKKD